MLLVKPAIKSAVIWIFNQMTNGNIESIIERDNSLFEIGN